MQFGDHLLLSYLHLRKYFLAGAQALSCSRLERLSLSFFSRSSFLHFNPEVAPVPAISDVQVATQCQILFCFLLLNSVGERYEVVWQYLGTEDNAI